MVDGVDNDASDQGSERVLVVSRKHKPGGPRGRRRTECFLVGSLIRIPVSALGQIVGRKLPVLVRDVQSSEKTLPLLFTGDVQEELHDPGAIPVEMVFEGVDVLEALAPQLLGRTLSRPFLSPIDEFGVHTY